MKLRTTMSLSNITNVKVTCAGCDIKFLISDTVFYRNKRWCRNQQCKEVIDTKVKNKNYRKAKRKMEKGTFRHGVGPELREFIKSRDDLTCRLCVTKLESTKAQVHHIVPVSFGGTDIKTNLVLLCSECHTLVHQNGWDLYADVLMHYTTRLANNQI